MTIYNTLSRRSACGSTAWILVFLASSAVAAPSINQASGTFNHKNTVTITGTGFGTKATAAPVVWDDASTGTLLTDNGKWSGAWPNRGSNLSYITQYHTPMRNVPLPHNNITRYIAGAHGLANEGTDAGYNVMFWKTRTITSYPQYLYLSWYQMYDPAELPINDGSWNLKFFDWSAGNSPYTMSSCTNNNWFMDTDAGEPFTSSSRIQFKLNDDSWAYSGCAGSLNPRTNQYGGCTSCWWSSGQNPFTSWLKYEIAIVLTNQESGSIQMWENGVQKINYSGRTDAWSFGTRSVAVGGYARSWGPNYWRYFADVYLDYTLQRVVLANNANLASANIIENQIPSSWADNSVTVSVNLGKFLPAQTAYLFIIDAAGQPNSTGFPVIIGSGGGQQASPPTGLTIIPSPPSQ